jgi:beta-hydroxylase
MIRNVTGFLANQSLVEDAPVVDRSRFVFLDAIEANWETIRDEIKPLLQHRDALPVFQELSRDQRKIAKDDNWHVFVLYGFGRKHEINCAKTPQTSKLLETVPRLQTAWFSILAPNYHIPAHRGVTKGILRCHLGLRIPKTPERCRMRVGDEMCVWREGELFVFDDTYEHEVWNDTDEERVVLLFDFDRPMRFWGRVVHRSLIAGLKRTAYFLEPKKKLPALDARLEAAIKRAESVADNLDDRTA